MTRPGDCLKNDSYPKKNAGFPRVYMIDPLEASKVKSEEFALYTN
jgi:hypothetical protein